MKRLLAVLTVTAFTGCVAVATDPAATTVPLCAEAFAPRDVTLLAGPFQHAMELDVAWLLGLDPDRLLAPYRREAGLEPRAGAYGGWESRGVSGHSLGHYLSACSRLSQQTDQAEFARRVDYIVDDLALCQAARTNGFVGGMPESQRVFDAIARGEIKSAGFDLNGSWVPWYNLHKVFAGLLDAYVYCDNTNALLVATRLGDWVEATTRTLTDAQWQLMLACEHGGMNESLADLFALTEAARYLKLAGKFYHRAVLDTLVAGRDELPGKHANTQIPKIIGAARLYELTGDSRWQAISRNFYDIVLRDHTYVTGGNSQGEHFGPSGRLNDRLGVDTTETCNTYNMLKLNRALYRLTPDAALDDYYERALWNHILASQHPEDGRVTYFLTLCPGETRKFLGPEEFTCCNGSGMENHVRYAENIYMHSADTLWVNQFIASELRWADKGLRLRQETDFPESGTTRFVFQCDHPVRFTLNLRHPAWCRSPAVKLNGQRLECDSAASSYLSLEREWRTGDTVELSTPFHLRTEAMPDNPNRIAIFYGPVLLAGDVGATGSTAPVPVLVTEGKAVVDWLKPVPKRPLTFSTLGVGRPIDVTLTPFYATHDHRHSVYWDLFTAEAWTERQAAYRAEQGRIKALEAHTVDVFQPGEMQAERDHKVKGEKSDPVEALGRKLRHAYDGGWFSFEMRVDPVQTNELSCTWWGGETGQRTFDILAQDTRIATQTLLNNDPGKFWEATYPLPADLTRGKSNVVIRLQAHPGNLAGGLFGARMLRAVCSAEPRSPPGLTPNFQPENLD